MSFVLAILAIRYRSRVLNGVVEGLILLTASTPRMVLALLALVVSLWLSIPTTTASGPSLFSLIAGAIVLAVPLISIFLAQLHRGLKDVMEEDFIRLARAKGLSEWAVTRQARATAALAAIPHACRPQLRCAARRLGDRRDGAWLARHRQL